MADSYADRIAALSAAAAAHAAEQAGAEGWFTAQCAAARESVAEAERQVAAAIASVAAATDAVEFTDRETARLWAVLASRAKDPTLGPPPAEADAAVGGLGAASLPGAAGYAAPSDEAREHPGRLLDHARELLDEVKPARVRRPAALLLTLVLLVLLAGAVVAATAVLRG